MQFVNKGPDIPDALLEAQEDGKVVFFCGAGISMPAGLPGFASLVDKLYESLGEQKQDLEESAIRSKSYDRAISLLENRYPGGRTQVRKHLPQILKTTSRSAGTTPTHEALLILSKDRKDRVRLVTTNFDQLFEKAIAEKRVDVESFRAPLLPLPNDRWHGLVYLHGLLPQNPKDDDLNKLVLSSGDFGLAYLSEGWAARFVSELFRSYTVCFVGYSIDDPVLRYMTDALAAERELGGSPIEMFAFGSYSKNKEEQSIKEWKAKNVTPILYKMHKRHRYLHETLRIWANIYRDGVSGKESIVTKHANLLPLNSTKQDDFVGKMLWALRDPSGLPAQTFADFNPVPSLDWFTPLSERRYQHDDLQSFGVPPIPKRDNDLKFSMTRRPSPYNLSPWMSLFDESSIRLNWDKVMHHLGRWLIRHLDDPKLLLSFTPFELPPHPEFAKLILGQLDLLERLDRSGNSVELEQIRKGAPRAIPRPAMRTLWRLVLARRTKSFTTFDIHGWAIQFKQKGLTSNLRLELLDLLTPRISIGPPYQLDTETESSDQEIKPKDLVDAKIVLCSDNVHFYMDELREISIWTESLPALLNDFSALLRDAMDLAHEIGEAEDRVDMSWVDQPSIADHEQNRRYKDWTVLIELCRDAWICTAKEAPNQAKNIIENWRSSPYPVFRRLVFFAAALSQDPQSEFLELIHPREALELLLVDDNWWLWATSVMREKMRLLANLAPRLDAESLIILESAVLKGPPRAMFKDSLDTEQWQRIVDIKIFQLLIRMAAKTELGAGAKRKLDELASIYTELDLEPKENDEFPIWMGDGSDLVDYNSAPLNESDLVEWLIQYSQEDPWKEDNWPEQCRDNPKTTFNALNILAERNIWPIYRWRQALNAWPTNWLIEHSWSELIPIVTTMPDYELQQFSNSFDRWLPTVHESVGFEEGTLFNLCIRLLEFDYEDIQNIRPVDPVQQAINHPIGYATKALLNWWLQGPLEDGEGLPENLRTIFTEICNRSDTKFRISRVWLASAIVTLFRVDREWVKSNLLPFFDWCRNREEARIVWMGYLRTPRIYPPFLEAIKQPFLDTPSHYNALGKYDSQYVSLLTYVALESTETFTKQQLATATETLPNEGLVIAATVLVQALRSSGEKLGEYWKNRILPYFQHIWPKSVEYITPAISQKLGEVCILAEDEFPKALELLQNWLIKSPMSSLLILQLHQENLCIKYPETALRFLDLVTDEPPQGDVLGKCLRQIESASPQLIDDPRFQELVVRFRSTGGSW